MGSESAFFIRLQRWKKKLETDKAYAERLGVALQTYRGWASPKTSPKVASVKLVADNLGLTPKERHWLAFGETLDDIMGGRTEQRLRTVEGGMK